uniref:uncharacterized protein LOC106676402 n=1 Tax=Maylandia zebra TaxID=106582 RepID=UPI000D30A8B6|nr:uncharacterized protein LOC106676402 [Maylandia zebra]
MWQCKLCKKVVSSRALLLKHYRLVHSRQQYPCAYSDCVCVFKTWNALHSHLSRSHTQRTLDKSVSLATFNCHLCSCCNIASEQEYFSHINNHLKCNETVHCMFEGCSFKTNIYGTFKSHRNRKHNPYTLKDFKIGIANTIVGQTSADDSTDTIVEEDISANIDHDTTTSETEDLANVIELNFASLLLKLENYFHVPSIAIDELLSELHYLISCASVPLTNQVIVDILKNHNLCLDQPVIEELTKAVSFNPLLKAIEKDGTLATAFKRRQYYRKHFEVIDPIEYILDSQSKRTFQYIPILKSLQQIFKQENILNKFVTSHNQNPFVNKEKRGNSNVHPNQVKKPRRAEVNFCPDYPAGETRESQEEERLVLLSEFKKKNNNETIKAKMAQTFPHRRQEILQDTPFVADFKSRWPALFSPREINAEFQRITTIPLTSTFMAQLDNNTTKLTKVFRNKGGTSGRKITEIMAAIDERHWLLVNFKVHFKILVLVLRALHGQAPSYNGDLLSPNTPSRSLRSSDQSLVVHNSLKTKSDRSLLLWPPNSGTLLLSLRSVDSNDTVAMRRVCTLKGLAVYLNEDPNSLIKEYQMMDQHLSSRSELSTVLQLKGIFHPKVKIGLLPYYPE